ISTVPDSDPFNGIRLSIRQAGQNRVLQIDLNMTWWSTRLYLTAFLAERLTDVRRFVVVKGVEFVGLLSTSAIVATLAAGQSSLRKVHAQLLTRRGAITDTESEMEAVFSIWSRSFGDKESASKVDVNQELLRRWFGDAMLQQPVIIGDLARASVVDLLRMLDYPNNFVPVVSSQTDLSSPAAAEPVKVVDKAALNAQLA